MFNANETSICRASLARQQGIVVAGLQIFYFRNLKNFLIKATRSALKIEIIFESAMMKRHSHHCPEFRKSVNSSEFSISDGVVCSKAGDSFLYE